MATFTSNVDEAGYGNRAYGGDGGMGIGGAGGIWAWFLVIIVVLWILFKDGFGHKDGHDYGPYAPYAPYGKGCCECLSNCDVDRDLLKEECKTRENATCEAEKTRSLITHNQDIADARAYQAQLAEITELKGVINTLNLKSEIKSDYQSLLCAGHADTQSMLCALRDDYDKLACELSHVAKTAPSYACTTIACQSTVPTCQGFEPRRCER